MQGIIIIDQARYLCLYSKDIIVMGVTDHFLIRFKDCVTKQSSFLVPLTESPNLGFYVVDARKLLCY